MFGLSAGHPKTVNVDAKFFDDNTKVSLLITGELNGPDGVYRQIEHEVVYTKDYKILLLHYYSIQRLNYSSGYLTDHYYMGDPSQSRKPFNPEAEGIKLVDKYNLKDAYDTALIRLDSDEVIVLDFNLVKCNVESLRRQILSDAFEGKLSDFTTEQLCSADYR